MTTRLSSLTRDPAGPRPVIMRSWPWLGWCSRYRALCTHAHVHVSVCVCLCAPSANACVRSHVIAPWSERRPLCLRACARVRMCACTCGVWWCGVRVRLCVCVWCVCMHSENQPHSSRVATGLDGNETEAHMSAVIRTSRDWPLETKGDVPNSPCH